MKKILFFAMVAAFLASCDKEVNTNGPSDPNTVVIGEETYKTATFANGQTWMIENLRFVPEGKTVSDNPAEGNIWYPVKKDQDIVILKDAESIKSCGYLYDYYTVMGINKEEYLKLSEEERTTSLKKLEGTQGICPEGWHIPTKAELVALCGTQTSANLDGTPKATDPNAPFYNKEWEKGSVLIADNLGFNFQFSGIVNKTTHSAIGKYSATNIAENAAPDNSYIGKCGMNYIWGSTLHQAVETKAQFFGMMSTFTSTNKGTLTVNHMNMDAGYSVRCIKNK